MSGALGVFGGTFDPVHLGHLAAAETAREALGLERVLFVPARRPPHKPGRPISEAGHRVAMLELALADNPAFAIEPMELERDGPSYTVDTLAAITERVRAAGGIPDLVFVCSTEALLDLPTWRNPTGILALARVAAVPRGRLNAPSPDWIAERFAGLEGRILLLDGPRIDISASALRERVSAGRSIRYLVPNSVAAYIADNALYRPTNGRTD